MNITNVDFDRCDAVDTFFKKSHEMLALQRVACFCCFENDLLASKMYQVCLQKIVFFSKTKHWENILSNKKMSNRTLCLRHCYIPKFGRLFVVVPPGEDDLFRLRSDSPGNCIWGRGTLFFK